ncbi:MAG: hypothetical protein ABR529_15835 [Actinomycetota bacterium]
MMPAEIPRHLGTQYGRAALANALDRIETTPSGYRHDTVFAAAAGVGNLLASGELRDESVVTTLIGQAEAIGLARRDAERTIHNGVARGRRTPKAASTRASALRSAAEARYATFEWWQAVQTHPWKGRSAATDLRILAGFSILALKAGKLRLNESYRQIALVAGVSVSTVSSRRHSWGRFVRLVDKGHRLQGTCSTWQLVTRVRAFPNTPEGSPSRENSGCSQTLAPSDPSDDLWFGWATGWRMYDILRLAAEPMSAMELAEVLGVHPSTARTGLRRLAGAWLAVRTDDGLWVALDRPAEKFDYHQKEQRRRYQADTELWRLKRAARLQERERLCLDRQTGEVLEQVGLEMKLLWRTERKAA